MKVFAAFLLIPAGIACYFALAFLAGWGQRIPWLAFALMVAGIAWLSAITIGKPSFGSIAAMVAALALSGLFAWWTLVYSEYPTDTPRAAAGDTISLDGMADVSLTDSEGGPMAMSTVLRPSANGRARLLFFYRGYW